jgi:hypothetical protein
MPDKINETTEYSINAITLISSTGKQVDIRYLVEDMNIYESIYSSVITGDMLIKDSSNLLTEYGVCGNEYIHISFQNPGLDVFDKYFRLYKVSDLKMRNLNTFHFTIHFCSEEFIINQQRRISKSYKDQKTGKIVEDIVLNTLGVSKDRFPDNKIEDVVVNQRIIIPNLRPFEAINYLCSISIKDTISSGFLFYESKGKFNFLALESLVTAPSYKTLQIKPQNINQEYYKQEVSTSVLYEFNVKQTFDVLEMLANGGYSSKMLSMDLLNQKHVIKNFDPVTNGFQTLNKYAPFNDAKNRFNNTMLVESAYLRYFPNFERDLVDTWLLQRASQMALLNNNRMNVVVGGDSQMQAGVIVDLDFPYFQPVNSMQDIEKDLYKSGKYLVTSVRHRIFNNKYFNYLELCKDSNPNGFASSPDDAAYKLAKTS